MGLVLISLKLPNATGLLLSGMGSDQRYGIRHGQPQNRDPDPSQGLHQPTLPSPAGLVARGAADCLGVSVRAAWPCPPATSAPPRDAELVLGLLPPNHSA